MFNQLRWAVAHDPCRAGDRAPLGAVPVGTNVRVSMRIDWSVLPLVRTVELLVHERGGWDEGRDWRGVPLSLSGETFSGELSLRPDPHVSFYLFVLTAHTGEVFYYVPCIDGRSTTGELVRGGQDGEFTEYGWKHSIDRWITRPAGDFGLQELPGGFQLTMYDPAFTVPDWMRGAVMYQIFPDRFARGTTGVRAEGVEYHARMKRPVALHESWDEPVCWAGSPVEATVAVGAIEKTSPYDPVDFFGGTLDGIREKLAYLASLGVEVLYLNPVFEARSNHRYDTADYERIDPLLGDESAFKQLASEAREYGISIVLDAVLSHTGDDSRYFNAAGVYDDLGAMQGPASPFYRWYDFANPSEGCACRCWWGFPSLPEVDEQDDSWQSYMLGHWWEGPLERDSRSWGGHVRPDSFGQPDGMGEVPDSSEIGVLGKWLLAGARGYRLDVADEIPDNVLERIRSCVKRADGQAAIIGEVWEDATRKTSYGAARSYALGRSLDSVMNYPLRSALIGFALGDVDAHQLATFLKQQKANYPAPLHAVLMNLLSTHDVERIRSVLALGTALKNLPREEQLRETSAITAESDERAARLQRMIVALLYALPGMPCVYYGDERGLQGGGDPFCRSSFPWDTSDRADCGVDLTAFYQRVGAERKESHALREGEFTCAAPDSDVICVFRYDVGLRVAVVAAANRSDIPRRVAIDLFSPALSLPSDAQAVLRNALVVGSSRFRSECDSLTIERISCEGGIVHITVPPHSTTYWQTGD